MNIKRIVSSHSPPNSKILCAGGPSKHLRKVGLTDVSITSLNIKDRDYRKLIKYGDTFVVGSITDAPFSDNMFDVCFSSNVFEHIDEPWRAAEECVRVVRSKGLIFVFGPFSWRLHDEPDYYRFSHTGLTYLFERTGKVKTIECKMVRMEKKKDKRWNEYWRTLYYGVKK